MKWAGRYYCGDGLGKERAPLHRAEERRCVPMARVPRSGTTRDYGSVMGAPTDVFKLLGRFRPTKTGTRRQMSTLRSVGDRAVTWCPQRKSWRFALPCIWGSEQKYRPGNVSLALRRRKAPCEWRAKTSGRFRRYLRMDAIEAKIKAMGELSVRTLEGAKNREEVGTGLKTPSFSAARHPHCGERLAVVLRFVFFPRLLRACLLPWYSSSRPHIWYVSFLVSFGPIDNVAVNGEHHIHLPGCPSLFGRGKRRRGKAVARRRLKTGPSTRG